MTPVMGTVRGVSKDTYASLAKLVLKNVINDSDNTVDKTNNDTTIEGDDLADMGVLRCYLSVFEIGRMTVDALERNLGDMQSCPFSVTLGKKLFERYSLLFKDIVNKKEDIVRGAGILHYISEDALKNADKGALADSYADVVEVLEEKHRRRRERDRDGFKEGMSREDRLKERTLEFQFLSPFIRAVAEQEKEGEKEIEAAAASEATTASGMRRRATGAEAVLTCSYIEIAGAAAKALDSKLLASLSSADFTDCAELLGDIDGWSSEQLVEHGKLAKAAWGQPKSWTPEVLLNAGNILATLTVDEIGQLNLTDVDALSAAATSTLFTSEQRAKLFATWLRKANNNMTNRITAEDILSLGKIACGATAANIDGISDLVYKESIAVWGSINTCGLEQRKAIARKVNSCFSPNATTWTVSILRQIGSAVVELPEKTLKLIPPRLVSDIPANHIKLMRPEMFSKLTVDQLSAMTVEQKSALTSEQKKALTPAKLKAVTGVNGKYGGSNEIDNKSTQSASDQDSAMLTANICMYRLFLMSLACLLHYL